MSVITSADISEFLTGQDDFDLELSIYRALLDKGLSSTHGGTYIDPVSGKARQFDIQVSIQFSDVGWGLNMAIECKSLRPDFPLVVSRVPRPEHESIHYLLHSGEDTRAGVHFANPVPHENGLPLYRQGAPVGKRTLQLRRDSNAPSGFKTGDNETYDKWSQALASANSLVTSASEGNRRYGKPSFFTFVLPVLVISDGTLWAVDYDVSGRRNDPAPTDECELFVDREYELPYGGIFTISHLHIYTRSGFIVFLRKLTAPNSFLVERMFHSSVP